MIILETGRDSDNDKHNKHHKYTLLYKQCQNSEMKVITQIYLIRAQAEVSTQRLETSTTCFLLLAICNRNSLMIQMEM